jgi:hypothetical protein
VINDFYTPGQLFEETAQSSFGIVQVFGPIFIFNIFNPIFFIVLFIF